MHDHTDELAYLEEHDPDTYQRFTEALRALVHGGPIPCVLCPAVFSDPVEWRHHAGTHDQAGQRRPYEPPRITEIPAPDTRGRR